VPVMRFWLRPLREKGKGAREQGSKRVRVEDVSTPGQGKTMRVAYIVVIWVRFCHSEGMVPLNRLLSRSLIEREDSGSGKEKEGGGTKKNYSDWRLFSSANWDGTVPTRPYPVKSLEERRVGRVETGGGRRQEAGGRRSRRQEDGTNIWVIFPPDPQTT